MKLQTLSIVTSVLFVTSLLVYYQEKRRNTDLLEGSYYVKGLDVSKIKKIIINPKDGSEISFTRDGSKFILDEQKQYPAATDKINNLIYQVASIQIKSKVASGVDEKDLKNYGLDEKSRQYQISMIDNDGNKSVDFSVGNADGKGRGNYLYKNNSSDIYLSAGRVWMKHSYKDFIDTVLANIKKDEVEKLSINGKKKINIYKEGQNWVSLPSKKKLVQDKISNYLQSFAPIKFQEFFTPKDPEVKSLNFRDKISIVLKSKLVNTFSLAKKSNKYFVKLRAFVNKLPEKIVVEKTASKERLKEVESMVQAQSLAQNINVEKGRWIYQIDKKTYESLAKKIGQLLSTK